MMTQGLLFFSFVAGLLTVLAPCVLPVLPVIIGGSMAEGRNWVRASVITVSLAASVVLFTLILKFSTALINIPPQVWTYFSGGIILFFGVITLFPTLWDQITVRFKLQRTSDTLLAQSARRHGWLAPILIGLSLGPVFSSCSPTYALILATVLPADFSLGLLYLVSYAIGLAITLLGLALLGQRMISRLRWAVSPESWFKRILGVLFIIVGLAIITGYEKRLETYLVENNLFDVTKLELRFLTPESEEGTSRSSSTVRLNVARPYEAPELTQISGWINTSPFTLQELRGKVVLVDFWTYSCINCVRTIPFLNQWYERYRDDGLVIVGVHAPEFSFEKVLENVQSAVTDYEIEYPVALDNDFATWQAYHNRFWPAKYFIDKQGRVRHTHFGEGEYAESEAVIRELLMEDGGTVVEAPMAISREENEAPVRRDQTPETYLGWRRADRYNLRPQVVQSEPAEYQLQSVGTHQWSLGGKWQVDEEQSESLGDGSVLLLEFAAKDVYLVMGSDRPVELEARLNGRSLTADNGGGADVTTDGKVLVDGARLYHLVSLPEFIAGSELELIFPEGVTVNAFTFGS